MKVSVLFFFLVVASAAAQVPERAQTSAPEQYMEYRIGPGDKISVTVFGLKEFDQNTRVSNSGKMHLSYLGVLQVARKSVAELEDEIAAKLREQRLVNEPWVRVQVTEYHAQPVYVMGEVSLPGQLMVTGPMRLLDALTKAGGVTQGASSEAFLIRRHDFSKPEIDLQLPPTAAAPGKEAVEDVPAGVERMIVNLTDLKEGRRPELNVPLQGGDVLFVPRRQQRHVYIVGDVMFPGAYGLPQQYDHITAGRVVSFAGGPLKTAKYGKGFIMRYDASGGIQHLPFNFADITRGKKPDIPMKPDDIIFVPRSVAKTIGYNMLILVPHLTQQFLIF